MVTKELGSHISTQNTAQKRLKTPVKDSKQQKLKPSKNARAVVETPAFGTKDKGFFKESKMGKSAQHLASQMSHKGA